MKPLATLEFRNTLCVEDMGIYFWGTHTLLVRTAQQLNIYFSRCMYVTAFLSLALVHIQKLALREVKLIQVSICYE